MFVNSVIIVQGVLKLINKVLGFSFIQKNQLVQAHNKKTKKVVIYKEYKKIISH